MSRLTGAFQSTRTQRLPPATTPSQTRKALCFPSTTAMAASSSGDFVTHQMQLRQQRRFCDGDVFRNSGVVFHNGNVFRNAGVFRIKGLCDALYHGRVRFFPVLAQICGCERWIFRNAKRVLPKDQVRSVLPAKARRKALQRDEKSFTTANLCQNHQNRDTFSPRPRRDLRKTRSPPAPNARLERRREIGAIQAKMAHPKIIGSPDYKRIT